MATAPANERTRALLDFERDWVVRPDGSGDKGAAISARFGISAARYYQLLARVIDDPAAMAYDPLTVRRLRRRRDERRNQRTARALGERTSR
jgi:hypothetical protein